MIPSPTDHRAALVCDVQSIRWSLSLHGAEPHVAIARGARMLVCPELALRRAEDVPVMTVDVALHIIGECRQVETRRAIAL